MKVISKLTAGYAQYLTLPPLSPFDYFRVTGKVSSLWEIDDCQMVLTEDCNSSSWAEKTSSQRIEELRLANYQKRCSPLSKILVIPALSGDQKSLFPPPEKSFKCLTSEGSHWCMSSQSDQDVRRTPPKNHQYSLDHLWGANSILK